MDIVAGAFGYLVHYELVDMVAILHDKNLFPLEPIIASLLLEALEELGALCNRSPSNLPLLHWEAHDDERPRSVDVTGVHSFRHFYRPLLSWAGVLDLGILEEDSATFRWRVFSYFFSCEP